MLKINRSNRLINITSIGEIKVSTDLIASKTAPTFTKLTEHSKKTSDIKTASADSSRNIYQVLILKLADNLLLLTPTNPRRNIKFYNKLAKTAAIEFPDPSSPPPRETRFSVINSSPVASISLHPRNRIRNAERWIRATESSHSRFRVSRPGGRNEAPLCVFRKYRDASTIELFRGKFAARNEGTRWKIELKNR